MSCKPTWSLYFTWSRATTSDKVSKSVVEKAGVAIKKLLQRSDPFKSRKCERGDCPVCREDGKGPGDRQCVTYDIKCTECNDIYIGAGILEEAL